MQVLFVLSRFHHVFVRKCTLKNKLRQSESRIQKKKKASEYNIYRSLLIDENYLLNRWADYIVWLTSASNQAFLSKLK